jgi:polysaccharide biosynthesis PFTS motif protein
MGSLQKLRKHLFKIFISVCKKRALRKIRYALRGYRKQKKNNRLDDLEKLSFQLSQISLYKSSSAHSFFFCEMQKHEVDAFLTQTVLHRYARYNLNPVILRSVGSGKSIRYPLCAEWIKKFQIEGYKIHSLACSLLWYIEILKLFMFGLQKFLLLLHGVVANVVSNKKKRPFTKSYSYFFGINAQCIKKSELDNTQYNLRRWFENLDVIYPKGVFTHSVKNSINDPDAQFIDSPFLPLRNLTSFLKFFFHGVGLIIISFFSLLKGRQAYAILLSDVVMSRYMRFMEEKDIAVNYFFHNSFWLHRPLWTYEAEKKGAESYLYFYSTNCERFKREEGYPQYDISCWHKMLWNNFFVWDVFQEKFIKKHLGNNVKCISTGPVYFTDSIFPLPDVSEDFIAVFDVQPFRSVIYEQLCEPLEYYTHTTAIKFLDDINYAVSKSNFGKIVFKRKRNVGDKVDKRYLRHLEKIESENETFEMVNPEIHAVKLIEKAKAVISMPFTSTSILAKEMNKPTVFYDPLNIICKDDIGSHGIKILTSRDELTLWLKNIKNK